MQDLQIRLSLIDCITNNKKLQVKVIKSVRSGLESLGISSVLTASTDTAKTLSIIQVSNIEHYFLSQKKKD